MNRLEHWHWGPSRRLRSPGFEQKRSNRDVSDRKTCVIEKRTHHILLYTQVSKFSVFGFSSARYHAIFPQIIVIANSLELHKLSRAWRKFLRCCFLFYYAGQRNGRIGILRIAHPTRTMRLLEYSSVGELSPTEDIVDDNDIPPYAILLYTWRWGDEVTFYNLINCTANGRPGY